MKPSPPTHPLDRCPKCGCEDLFVRKDLPRLVALAILVGSVICFLTLAANPRTMIAGVWVLVGSAVLLLIVYLTAGRYTVCYRCRAEFHDQLPNPNRLRFDPLIAGKYPPPLPSNESWIRKYL